MLKFKQFIQESIGDVWRSVARHLRNTPSSKAHKIADEVQYHNLGNAVKHYHASLPTTKSEVDTILKNHSHYHDVHGEFHQHYQAHLNTLDKPKPDVKRDEDGNVIGSYDHFRNLAHNIAANMRLKRFDTKGQNHDLYNNRIQDQLDQINIHHNRGKNGLGIMHSLRDGIHMHMDHSGRMDDYLKRFHKAFFSHK